MVIIVVPMLVIMHQEQKRPRGVILLPFANARIFSTLTFSWIGPIISVGNKRALDLEDVPQLDNKDSLVRAFPIYRGKLEADCGTIDRITTLRLAKSLVFSVWKEILYTSILALLHTLATYVGPYLIDTFVQYLNEQQDDHQRYVLVSAFFLAKVVECLSERLWFFIMQRVGIRIRALLVTMIYNKSLTISCQSKLGHTSGEIINFVSVDAERVGLFSYYMHDMWLIALQVIVALLSLYKNLGLASVAAFFATIIVMLANVPLGSLQEKFQDKMMESKDKRMKATSEVLRNMRILKLSF